MASQVQLGANVAEATLGVLPHSKDNAWTVRSFLLLAAVGVPTGVVFLVCYALGQPKIGGILAGFPVALLALWRAELGLCMFALVLPIENLAVVAEGVRASKILGILVAVTGLLHVLRRGRVEMRSWVFWLALGFVTWSLLTIYKAVDPVWALQTRWVTLFQMVVLVFVIINICDRRRNARLFYWTIFLAAAFAAIAGFLYAPVQGARLTRQTFAEANINAYAKSLLPTLFLAPFLMVGQKRVVKYIVVLLVFCGFAALVRTGSRSAWGAAFLGILAMILAYRRIAFTRRVLLSAIVVATLAGLVAFGVATGLFATGLWDRILEIQEKGLMTGGRGLFWSRAISLGMENPLMGVGIGSARWAPGAGIMGAVTHNDVLAFFAETGVLGTLLYLGVHLAALVAAWKTGPDWLRAGLIGLLVASFMASFFNPSAYLKTYWVHLGAVAIGPLVFPRRGGRSARASSAENRPGSPVATGGTIRAT